MNINEDPQLHQMNPNFNNRGPMEPHISDPRYVWVPP